MATQQIARSLARHGELSQCRALALQAHRVMLILSFVDVTPLRRVCSTALNETSAESASH
jgi:hypothetical protein